LVKMPSSVRQKLPAELWRHCQHRHASSSPVLISGLEMQASPGLCEDFKQPPRSPSRKVHLPKTQHKKHNTSGKGWSKPMLFRGSTDALDDLALSDGAISGSSCSSSVDMSLLSQSSSDSDSNVEYSSSRQPFDAFAMDAAASAPHPSQVPLPPMEWLKSTSKSPLTVGRSLQVMLACHAAA